MNRRFVTTVGVFDGIHTGHRAVLETLKAEADRRGVPSLVIILAGNYKGTQMITSDDRRAEILGDTGVDEVWEIDFNQIRSLTGEEFLTALARNGADALVMGFNNRIGCDAIGIEEATRLGIIDIVAAPEVGGVSSTAIREAVNAGRLSPAAVMLGTPFFVEGTVVHGRHLGRTLGFPTANVSVPACIVMPPIGVYAARATVDGSIYDAMVNVGQRPTFDIPGQPTVIEANIFGLDMDLYGKNIQLSFVSLIRSERKFGTREALADQLVLDRQQALKILHDK